MLDKRTIKLYERIRVPELYWDASLSRLPDAEYADTVRNWVLNIREHLSGKGLYIFGQFGTGKSAIAAMILRAAVARGIFGLWVNFRDIANYKTTRAPFDDVETYYERMLSVPLLVIDEVEFSSSKWFLAEILEDVVRTRHQNKKVSIITSNNTPTFLFTGNKNTDEEKKRIAMLEGFVGVMPEVFLALEVIGKNFRKKR